MSSRLTKKQRMKIKRDAEAAHKAFMRRGEIIQESRARRDEASKAKPKETPREQHVREQREASERRAAERRADHALPEDRQWIIAVACTGREAELRRKLEEAKIPAFRAQDEVVQVVSGRARRLKVPILPGMIFVGLEHRGQLDELAREHPWLMQRVPGERFGRVRDLEQGDAAQDFDFSSFSVGDDLYDLPPETFPWLVARYAVAEILDQSGQPVLAPAVVPQSQMRNFADCIIAAAPLFDPAKGYVQGEAIRVTDGSFRSFNGTIDDIDSKTGMLKVSVSIFGRATPVQLAPEQVERA